MAAETDGVAVSIRSMVARVGAENHSPKGGGCIPIRKSLDTAIAQSATQWTGQRRR